MQNRAMNQPALPIPNIPVRILVVDDHPNTAATLARAIAQLGSKVDVVSATSGYEALERVKDGAADILITDMIMPGMSGLELIEQLQKHPAGRPAFSFLMTAYDVLGLRVTAHRLKVKDVIVKPVHPERICQIIIQAMQEMNQDKPAYKEPALQKSFNILIADDQPDNLTLLARYLGNEGYSYIMAKDGLETLEKARNELPDLILLDVNMPHKDGFTVLKEIREDPAIQHIPVIILTAARLAPSEIQSGLNLGADDYVTKPFDRRELLARIRTRLRVKKAEDVIRRRNRELNLLPEIGKDLSARLNINELTDIVLRRTVETLGAMLGHIIILDSRGPLHKKYHVSSTSSIPEMQLPALNDMLQMIKETRQSLIIADTQHDPVWHSMSNAPANSVIIVPMFGRHELIGVLILIHEQTGYFNLEHQLLLQAIAGQAAIAVENAQLYASVAKEQLRLTAVLQSAADAILVFDADSCLSLLNPAGEKLFIDYDAKLGLPLARGCGYDSLIELLDETCTSSKPMTGEFVSPDRRAFSVLLTPIEEGGYVVVLHDVTHFKELERVKDEFIATASHDLRNPIASIKGFSHLIKHAGPLNDNQNDFVQRIQNAVENMSELVENMLDLTKMDLGAELKHEVLNVSSLIWEIADEFQPQAEAKRLLLTLDKTETSSKVQGDMLQLRQALRNLIGNAIKYTPNSGTITLSLEHKSNMAVIHIRDTGYGIPADDLPFIFDRFYRAHNDNVIDIEGNGLGLAIVKSIVERHSGQISVESKPGIGSCFTIALPLVQLDSSSASDSELSKPDPIFTGEHLSGKQNA
jgi:signal transduction histidine kinase/DNA-binding response OmpR family regulator